MVLLVVLLVVLKVMVKVAVVKEAVAKEAVVEEEIRMMVVGFHVFSGRLHRGTMVGGVTEFGLDD